jgi:hypothetical protein
LQNQQRLDIEKRFEPYNDFIQGHQYTNSNWSK